MQQHPDEEEWGNTTADWGMFDLHCPNNSMFTPISPVGSACGLRFVGIGGRHFRRFAINDLARQNAECCCSIKGAILSEGAATRQLIQNNLITELQTQLCDSKSRIATLESNAFTTASNAAQTQQIINTILPHILTKSVSA